MAINGSGRSWLRRWRLHRRAAYVRSLQLVLVAAIFAVWQWAAGPRGEPGTYIDEFYVSQPTDVWESLVLFYTRGLLWDSILATLQVTLTGFLLGSFLGLLIGFLLGVSVLAADVFRPIVAALYSIPRLALVPLFILWFGIGDASKVALVVSVVFFLVFYSTFAGVRDVDRELLAKLRIMRARPWQVHLKVTLPAAGSYLISGLSISGPYALVAAVTAEMLSSNRGLGFLLIQASRQYNTSAVFAAIFLMMLIGIALMTFVHWVERRLLPWKQPDSGGGAARLAP